MSCRYLTALPALLLLAACNQNEPADVEVPTQAGAPVPTTPVEAATIDPTEMTSEAGTPLESGVAEPVPDEYAQEDEVGE